MLLLAAVLPSLLIAWAAAFYVRRKAAAWGLVDRPGERKIHHEPMPMGGGLAIWAGIVIPFAVGQLALTMLAGPESLAALLPTTAAELIAPHLSGLAARSGQLWTLLAAATLMLLLGLTDDRRGLDWRLRLSLQTAVAIVMVSLGWRLTAFLDWPWVTGALSVLWIVGLTNTFNMLDNMDGLSAGTAAIAAAILAVVMLLTPESALGQPQLFVAGFLCVMTGALLGFLWHNHNPARIFMGDGGSYLIGFLLATTTLSATFAGGERPGHAILAPLCVLAVPLYDTVTVVSIRLRKGQSPFVGDNNHFSHRLVALGLTPRHAVWTIYLATATCGLLALLLPEVGSGGALVVLLVVGCVLSTIAILETAGRRR